MLSSSEFQVQYMGKELFGFWNVKIALLAGIVFVKVSSQAIFAHFHSFLLLGFESLLIHGEDICKQYVQQEVKTNSQVDDEE